VRTVSDADLKFPQFIHMPTAELPQLAQAMTGAGRDQQMGSVIPLLPLPLILALALLLAT